MDIKTLRDLFGNGPLENLTAAKLLQQKKINMQVLAGVALIAFVTGIGTCYYIQQKQNREKFR